MNDRPLPDGAGIILGIPLGLALWVMAYSAWVVLR